MLALRLIAWMMLMAGVLLIANGLSVITEAYWYQWSPSFDDHPVAFLADETRQTTADPKTAANHQTVPKTAVSHGNHQVDLPEGAAAILTVPRLKESLVVGPSDSAQALKRGPGIVRTSVLPGTPGNCLIAAHRDLHFRFLKDIQIGDEIILENRDGRFIYQVVDTNIVGKKDTRLLEQSLPVKVNNAASDSRLTLITCYPFYYVGKAPKRFIVTAELVTSEIELPAQVIAGG